MPGLAALRRKINDDMSDEAMHLTALAETGRALSNDCISQDALGKLARYEAMLMNALKKSLQMLFLLQDNRYGKDAAVILEATQARPAWCGPERAALVRGFSFRTNAASFADLEVLFPPLEGLSTAENSALIMRPALVYIHIVSTSKRSHDQSKAIYDRRKSGCPSPRRISVRGK